ncbi:hypothetical protein F4819DRAFT_491089 [Hypoxylon fuscum]|nr:hypothetical protein F4819DRAFT_491089 [Hypoxylon fuscum]
MNTPPEPENLPMKDIQASAWRSQDLRGLLMDLESTLDRLREVTPIIKGSDLESVVRQVQSVYEYLSPLIKDLQEIGRDLSIVKEMFHSIFTKFEKLTIQEEEIQKREGILQINPSLSYLCQSMKMLVGLVSEISLQNTGPGAISVVYWTRLGEKTPKQSTPKPNLRQTEIRPVGSSEQIRIDQTRVRPGGDYEAPGRELRTAGYPGDQPTRYHTGLWGPEDGHFPYEGIGTELNMSTEKVLCHSMQTTPGNSEGSIFLRNQKTVVAVHCAGLPWQDCNEASYIGHNGNNIEAFKMTLDMVAQAESRGLRAILNPASR